MSESTRRQFIAAFPGWLAAAQSGAARPPSSFEPAYLKLHRTGELARRGQALWQIMTDCELCPRQCGARRLDGKAGFCGASSRLQIAAHHPHFGEERSLVGRGGSGTIFFTHCNLRCVFCINWEISQDGEGATHNLDSLAGMMLALQSRGCHNVNLVTPTHYAAHIVRALDLAAARGLRLPIVYNTSGWERVEILRLLDGIVDIYLPDFKYADADVANRYSSGARHLSDGHAGGPARNAPAGGRGETSGGRVDAARPDDPTPRPAEPGVGHQASCCLGGWEPAERHVRERHVAVSTDVPRDGPSGAGPTPHARRVRRGGAMGGRGRTDESGCSGLAQVLTRADEPDHEPRLVRMGRVPARQSG